MGLQLTLNVIGMLFSFVAIIAMANVMVGWLGSFFGSTEGLVQLDLVLFAMAAGVLAVSGLGEDLRSRPVGLVVCGACCLRRRSVADAGCCAHGGSDGYRSLASYPGGVDSQDDSCQGFVYGIGVVLGVSNLSFVIFGPLGSDTPLSMQLILGWLHWPIAFLMGTPIQDCLVVGRMLGEKLILTEFVAYADLAGYLQASRQGTVTALDPRSVVITSYALSGFANFVSIAIQIGGISPLAPSRRHEIARLGLKAMIGGAITSYIIACVAGTFYNGVSMLGL